MLLNRLDGMSTSTQFPVEESLVGAVPKRSGHARLVSLPGWSRTPASGTSLLVQGDGRDCTSARARLSTPGGTAATSKRRKPATTARRIKRSVGPYWPHAFPEYLATHCLGRWGGELDQSCTISTQFSPVRHHHPRDHETEITAGTAR